MREAPWTLKAYVVLGLAELAWVVVLSIRVHAPVGAPLFGGAGILALLFFTLRGSRVAWSIELAFTLLSLGSRPFLDGQPWWIPVEILDLALLIAPPSWRYVWTRRPAPAPPHLGSGVGAAPATATPPDGPNIIGDREVGWHIDPAEPYRMRYWSRDGEWTGKRAPTPRKLRREWEEANR